METQQLRFSTISEIIDWRDKHQLITGKIAMQKLIFLIQKKGLFLNYYYKMFTYGPFSSELMNDLDVLEFNNGIVIDWDEKLEGYKIRKGTDYNKYHNTFEDKEIEIIDRVLENFGTKKSRELELTSTIIFLNDNFKLDAQELKHEIIKIKPKFSEKEIDAAQMELKNLGYYSYKK